MDFLKRIPIQYKGELHDVRLVNFSVARDEVAAKVPAGIKIRDFNGRALFSMVDVQLKNMHPVFLPSFCHFNYRHVAFRLLVEDAAYNAGVNKGIYFYRSFGDNAFIVAGGKFLTDYRLALAKIEDKNGEVIVSQGKDHVAYRIEGATEEAALENAELKMTIGALDRAYSVLGKTVRVTQIQRKKWPIQSVACSGFENTFFKTARFEGAFRVMETIHYRWLPPQALEP